MMEAGELTDRIVFERKTTSQSDLASVSTQTTWTHLLTTWAQVKILSATDQLSGGKTTGENRIRISIRYRTDVVIKIGDRVTWRDSSWLIETPPINDERRFFYTFDAIVDFVET